MEHSGSAPPTSPPPPKPERQPTGAGYETTAEQRDRYRRELAVLRPLAERVSILERDVGHPPDPSSSPPDLGSGMRRTLAEIRLDLAEIKGLVLRGEASRAAVSSRASWALWLFVGALLVLLAGAVWRLGDRVRIVDRQASDQALSKR